MFLKIFSSNGWPFSLHFNKSDILNNRHDHLYSKISTTNVIRSDMLKSCKESPSVILCTLSTLSNPNIRFISRLNPVRSLVIDEASQIGLGDYLPVFAKYETLRKICFIGDDKQCEL